MSGLFVVLVSIPGVLVSFGASWLFHPIVYHEQASTFSKLRAGPGIGIGILLLLFLPKRAALRTAGLGEVTTHAPTLLDLFAFLWALFELAAGVTAADLLRSIRAK